MAKLIMQEEASAPSTPASGKWVAYFKASGLYVKDDADNEYGPLDSSNVLLTTGGTSTAYTITTLPATALITGETFRVKFHTTAGATPTINRDGLGAKPLKYYDAAGAKQAATSAQIITNMILTVLYDGTDYVILGGGSSGGSSGGGGGFNQGFMTNGKIAVTVASNNLTVALKTLAGADPSAGDPVQIRIGDVVRDITSALSVTKNAGTNWCNAGSAELATKEIDYFAYIGYNATDGITIGFSRIPYANIYSDFSATTTNQKYCAISTITNAAASDNYVNVGRFAATLSAGAGYTWTVPTYTGLNLIQRPIFETRPLTWAPQWSASGSMTYTTVTTDLAEYKIVGSELRFEIDAFGTIGGTVNTSTVATLPFTARNASYNPAFSGWVNTTGSAAVGGYSLYINGSVYFRRYDFGNWSSGSGRYANGNGVYMI